MHGVERSRRGQDLHASHRSADEEGVYRTAGDDYLTEIISEGGEKLGKSGFMPSFKTTLSGEQIGT